MEDGGGRASERGEGESKSVGRRLRFADSIRADVGRRKDGDGDKILWKRRMWLERTEVTTKELAHMMSCPYSRRGGEADER